MGLANVDLGVGELSLAGSADPQPALRAAVMMHPSRWARPTIAAALAIRTPLSIEQWCDRLDRIEAAIGKALGPFTLRRH